MKPRRLDPEALLREAENQREAFRQSATTECQRLADAQARLQAVRQNGRDEDLLFELQRRAHKLAGRGGTFGFPQVSETARALEVEMDRIIRSSEPVGAPDVDLLGDMVSKVQSAVDVMS